MIVVWFWLIFASFSSGEIGQHVDDLTDVCGVSLRGSPLENVTVACKTLGYTVGEWITREHNKIRWTAALEDVSKPVVKSLRWNHEMSERIQIGLETCSWAECSLEYNIKMDESVEDVTLLYYDSSVLRKANWARIVRAGFYDKANTSSIWLMAEELGCGAQRYLDPEDGKKSKAKRSVVKNPAKVFVQLEDDETDPDFDPEGARSGVSRKYRYRFACLYKMMPNSRWSAAGPDYF